MASPSLPKLLSFRDLAQRPSAMSEKKPYFVAVLIQLTYTGYFVTSKAAFDKGLSTFVFIFYRHIAASLLLASLAAIFQRYSPHNPNAVYPKVKD